MKLTHVASPNAIQQPVSNASERTAKAIAAFNNKGSVPPAAPKEQPIVQNANAVQPEEMTAIKAPSIKAQGDESTELESIQEVIEETQPKEETKPEEDPVLSKQFAQLARQEKALRAKQMQQDQVFKQKEADLKAREDALASKDAQYQSGYLSKDSIKANPLLALTQANVSYDDLTQQILNQQALDPRVEATISELKAEIKALKDGEASNRKLAQENETKQYDNAVNQIRVDVKRLVEKNPEEYETIAKTGSIEDVVDLIKETYKKDGVLLTNEEAAQEVENYLIEETVKLHNINKIKSRIQKAQTVKTPVTEKKQVTEEPKQQQQPTMKTLTNAASASRPLSARERAIAAFKGQKTS